MERIYIRNNETGEVRSDVGDYFEEGDDFMWEEGNYSCDCNRYLFYQGFAGDDKLNEMSCGHERFSVKIETKNGETLYCDDDWNKK